MSSVESHIDNCVTMSTVGSHIDNCVTMSTVESLCRLNKIQQRASAVVSQWTIDHTQYCSEHQKWLVNGLLTIYSTAASISSDLSMDY